MTINDSDVEIIDGPTTSPLKSTCPPPLGALYTPPGILHGIHMKCSDSIWTLCRILLILLTFYFFFLSFGFQSVNITQNPQSVHRTFRVNFDNFDSTWNKSHFCSVFCSVFLQSCSCFCTAFVLFLQCFLQCFCSCFVEFFCSFLQCFYVVFFVVICSLVVVFLVFFCRLFVDFLQSFLQSFFVVLELFLQSFVVFFVIFLQSFFVTISFFSLFISCHSGTIHKLAAWQPSSLFLFVYIFTFLTAHHMIYMCISFYFLFHIPHGLHMMSMHFPHVSSFTCI